MVQYMYMKKFFREVCDRVRSFRLAARPMLFTAFIMLAATAVSAVLHRFFIQNNNVSMIYALAVVVIACVTPGYFYGFIASLVSMFCVNYFFAEPYWALDFSQTGYPITFLTLLIASMITSTLVTGYRERDRARLDAENEKLRSNLLRAISHDLRTPLTSISGASTAILENGSSLGEEDRTALLGDIRDNAQWLIRMVENLLSVTKMQGGNTALQKTPDMAEEVVAQAVAQIRRRFPKQKLKISVPEEPFLVPMDGTLIEQVLINLIENAIYHSGTDMPIEIRVEKRAQAVFTVRDHGVGVDEAYIRKLFNGHIDSTRTGDQSRGMGIGLSLCAAIVRAHGGEIEVRNAPKGGALFSFTLPPDGIYQ